MKVNQIVRVIATAIHAVEIIRALTECSWGGCRLDEEEVDNLRLDPDGSIICDRCYGEHFQFKCCRCLDYEEDEHQHEFLVVWEQVGEVKPGIYQVVEYSYWGGPLIGDGWLDARALRRVRDLEEDAEGNGYPCGRLCMGCRDMLLPGHKALVELNEGV